MAMHSTRRPQEYGVQLEAAPPREPFFGRTGSRSEPGERGCSTGSHGGLALLAPYFVAQPLESFDPNSSWPGPWKHQSRVESMVHNGESTHVQGAVTPNAAWADPPGSIRSRGVLKEWEAMMVPVRAHSFLDMCAFEERIAGVTRGFGAKPEPELHSSSTGENSETKKEASVDAPIITLVLGNLPIRATVDDVLSVIWDVWFEGAFKFMHMPMKTLSNKNKGYAYVAFEDKRQADAFLLRVNGACFRGRVSRKPLMVTAADERTSWNLHGLKTIKECRWGPIVDLIGNDGAQTSQFRQ